MKFSRQDTLSIVLVSIVLGLVTDILIRQEIFGLNFVLWTLAWLVIASLIARRKRKLDNRFLLFVLLASINANLVYVRSEPIVQFWSVCCTLALLILLTGSLYIDNFSKLPLLRRLGEYIAGSVTSVIDGISLMVKSRTRKKTIRINKGAVIATGLGVIFIALFASSDEVFRNNFLWLGDSVTWLGNLLDTLNAGRLISIIILALLSFCVLLMMLLRKSENPSETAVSLPKSLSEKDAIIILGTVTAIFVFFLLIQARFLFAGSELPNGLTYANYARRGYGELLVATLLASTVIQSVIASIPSKTRNKSVMFLAAILVICNALVVLSAWKRLGLYESAYGWTIARFVAQMGLLSIITGCGCLLLWVGDKITSKQLFASGWYIVLFVCMGAAILNPAGIIAQNNITERQYRDAALDTSYILTQSRDSWPAICKYGGSIKLTFTEDYLSLTSGISSDTYYTEDVDNFVEPTKRTNHGFAAHYTRSEEFVKKYANCLE